MNQSNTQLNELQGISVKCSLNWCKVAMGTCLYEEKMFLFFPLRYPLTLVLFVVVLALSTMYTWLWYIQSRPNTLQLIYLSGSLIFSFSQIGIKYEAVFYLCTIL
jgi:hypothetical protein